MIQQQKSLENSNIVDVKSASIEYPKTSHKLSKTTWQAEKVSQVSGAEKVSTSALYSETR